MRFDFKRIFGGSLLDRPQAPVLTANQQAAWNHGQGMLQDLIRKYGGHDRLKSGQTMEDVAIDLSDAVLASAHKKPLLLYLGALEQRIPNKPSLDDEIGREILNVIRIKQHRKFLIADAAILQALIRGAASPTTYYKMVDGLYEEMRPAWKVLDETCGLMCTLEDFIDISHLKKMPIPLPPDADYEEYFGSCAIDMRVSVLKILEDKLGNAIDTSKVFRLLTENQRYVSSSPWPVAECEEEIAGFSLFPDGKFPNFPAPRHVAMRNTLLERLPGLRAGLTPKQVLRYAERTFFEYYKDRYENLIVPLSEEWKRVLSQAGLPVDAELYYQNFLWGELEAEKFEHFLEAAFKEIAEKRRLEEQTRLNIISSLEFYPYSSALQRSHSLIPNGAHFFVTGYHLKAEPWVEAQNADIPPDLPHFGTFSGHASQ